MSNGAQEQSGKTHDRDVTIKVNGTDETVPKGSVTYDQIVAFGIELGLPTGPNFLYTITYRKAESKPHEGDLDPGTAVEVREGTIFNVTATDKS